MTELTQRLAEMIERMTGNVIPEGQYPHLSEVVGRRAREAGYSDLHRYVTLLDRGQLAGEWKKLLSDITIKESFLYRIPEQFEALAQELLPRLVERRPASHTLRVWSAGCARGEEPATLAIVLAECACMANRSWQILASDVDEEALSEARRGEYGQRAVARVPEHLLRRYFERRGDHYSLSQELQRHIDYRPFNLVKGAYTALQGSFDLIFLRNVLIYFHPEAQRRVVARVVARLADDGYLFLGHSESLWQLNDQMEPVELENCFAYRPLGAEGELPERAQRRIDRLSGVRPRPPLAEILRAGRIAQESKSVPRPALPSREKAPVGEEPESLLPRSRRADLEAASRALAANRLEEARELIEKSLPAHKSDTFAHALHGLIHDLSDEAQEAVAAYRAALFLDPELFQVRFLLARRFEHLGWDSRARNEYRQVLTTLENGRSHELTSVLPSLLPSDEEIAKRCRKALSRT